MQIKQCISFIFSIASLAVAQNISGLPTCATAGALAAVTASACAPSDTTCLCNSATFIYTLQQYAQQNCNDGDYSDALQAGEDLCSAVGIDINMDTSSPSTTANRENAATTAAAASTDTAAQASSNTTSTSASVSGNATSPATSTTSNGVIVFTTTKCSCQEVTYTSSISTSAPIATYTGAAMKQDAEGQMIAGIVGFAGLLALF